MRRNWEVVRSILLRIEESTAPGCEVYLGDFEPVDTESVAYNMRLLHEAGLILGIPRDSLNASPSFIATGMTWAGHELLDVMRGRHYWGRIKELGKQKGVDLSFEIMSQSLIHQIISSGLRFLDSSMLSRLCCRDPLFIRSFLPVRMHSVDEIASGLENLLHGEEKVFNIENVNGFPLSFLVNAKALAEHVPLDRSKFLPFLVDTLAAPSETWLTFERHRGTGRVVLRARVIKAYQMDEARSLLMVFQSRGGF